MLKQGMPGSVIDAEDAHVSLDGLAPALSESHKAADKEQKGEEPGSLIIICDCGTQAAKDGGIVLSLHCPLTRPTAAAATRATPAAERPA